MFSQYEEEKYILEVLTGRVGTFLDIGAWHPTDKSNTRALFERGWSGIMIEPSPGPMLNLLNEYSGESRIKLIQAAVSVEPGLVDVWVTDDALSTADRQQYEAWKAVGKFRGQITVPALTMADLFGQFGGDFQMVSIDTEGTSSNLFAEMIRIGPRPKVVVVEHDSRIVEINQYAQAANYRQIHINGTNVVFEWGGRKA